MAAPSCGAHATSASDFRKRSRNGKDHFVLSRSDCVAVPRAGGFRATKTAPTRAHGHWPLAHAAGDLESAVAGGFARNSIPRPWHPADFARAKSRAFLEAVQNSAVPIASRIAVAQGRRLL